MPARRRNPPPTSTPPSTTPATPATKKATRATATTTTTAQAKTGAAVGMTTTTTTLRRSPRLIVTGHYHQSRALQKQAEPKTKNLKRPCCQPGRTRAGRGVLPDPVAMGSSSSSTSEEEEEDMRVTSCTTRRKRKENSTTLLVESPAKRLRTRAVVVTTTAPPKPRNKPKVSSQAPSPSSTSRPPGGRLTRSSTIASRTTITTHKIIPSKTNTPSASRRSSPEPAPPALVPPPAPSPPPQHGLSLIPCKSNASSPTSSPSTSAFTLLASSLQRVPLDMIDIGPPLISHNESSRHSVFSGIPGLVSSSTESKDCDQYGHPMKTVAGTGIWTSPPSPLTPLSTAPPSPTSPTSVADVFDVKLDVLSSSLSSPPSSPVLPSAMPSLAASSSATHDSMDVDVQNTGSDSNLAALEAVSMTHNTGPSSNQSEHGVNVSPQVTQPQLHLQPSTIQDMTTTATTYGYSQEQLPHFQLSPQAQPSQSQSQSQIVQIQGQTQPQPQSQQHQPSQHPPAQQQQQQSAFTHPCGWYDLPDSSAQQQPILHWEDPPRLESTKNVWKFACKYRVWDVLCRYTPNIIRSVVAQEASDYHTVHGYPSAYFARARHQRMRRRIVVDTSVASGSGGTAHGTSTSSPGLTSGGRKKRRKVEINEKGGKEKDKEKKAPKSKSRNGTPTPDVMEGVEVSISSAKECKESLQLPTLQQPSPQPSPTSPPPESERERFMDEEYYDWEIRSDGDEEDEDDEEVFYYYDEDDEDEEDDDDECYDEETDSEDEDYMDDEMFDGSQAVEVVEAVEKGSEHVAAQMLDDGKKKHRIGDPSLEMDMDVSKDPSFNAELTSLSCSSIPPSSMVSGSDGGCAKATEDASLQQRQEDVGTAKGVEPSTLLASPPTSSSGATATSSFLPLTPPHSFNTNAKPSSPTRSDTLISMFYCPPPHPQHVNHLNSHAHSPQANLTSAPQQQQQTQEPSLQLSQPVQPQHQELQAMESPQPVQSLQPSQPMKPLQPIPSTQPHQSPSPALSPFVSDPSHLAPPIRPATPAPTSPVFCINEYGGNADRYSNAVPAVAPSSPLAPISPVNPVHTPISPTTPINPITPISPLSTPIPAPPVLPLPPPRLASIRVRPLRYGDLGLASVIGKGTPVDRDRAMQWARAGQCDLTWSNTASGTSTRGHEASRMQEMSDAVMKDMRDESPETKDMGEITANTMALGSLNNGECETKAEQGQSQGQQELSQPQHGHQEQTQRQPQGSQEQDRMQIVTAFSETDQSIWDAFFATLQVPDHEVTGEMKPQPVTEPTSSSSQSMLNPGDTNTACTAPGTGTASVTASSSQMSEHNNSGAPSVAPGNSAPPVSMAMNVNAATTMFTSMGFSLGGALGMGFVSGSVNVNHISLGFGPGGSVPETIPSSQQGSSASSDQCSTPSPTSSPLTSNVSGGPLSNMMNPLYPTHHPSPAHMGNVVGDISSMTMNGVQTYISGSPMSIPLSMSMPMGMSGMGTMDMMGMTIPMPVVPSHEPSSSPSTPMAAAVTAGSSSCSGSSTPGTSALSFALG